VTDAVDKLEVLLSADEISRRVDQLADRLAPRLNDDCIGVCLLLGGLWFAADLTRALARRGKRLAYDALWLSSYGQGRESAGACEVLAGPQRSLAGRQALIMDDVADTGVSLRQAADIARAAGATGVITAVFARKPAPSPRDIEPDDFAWDAPARFLIGYGMDVGGRHRDLPFVAAAD
jgi:hypoxanthine phosphoribosyltransferase